MSQQHKKLNIKIKIMISFIILICCLIPIIFTSFMKVEANSDWLQENKISISASLDQYAPEVDYSSNQISEVNYGNTVKVYVATKLSESNSASYSGIRVPVRIRTKDYTAIDYENYNKFDDVIYLSNRSGDIIYQIVRINIWDTGYAVDGETLSFYVEVVDVLAEKFSINTAHNRVKVNLLGKYYHTSTVAYGQRMFDEYLTADNYRLNFDTGEIIDQEGKEFTYYADELNVDSRLTTISWAYKTRFKDLASIYVGNEANVTESKNHLSSYFQIEIWDYDTNGRLFTGSYRGMDNENTNIVFGSYIGEGESKDVSYLSAPNGFCCYNNDWGRRLLNVYLKTKNGKIYIKYKNGSDYFRRINNWDISWILIDNTAPYIKRVSYMDKNFRANDKIEFAVKFNEPVYYNGNINDLKIKATLTGTGDFANKEVEFVCTKAGSSDTVIFSYDPTGLKGSISNIKLKNFVGDSGSKIVDYGRNYQNNNNVADCGNLFVDHPIKYSNSTPNVDIVGGTNTDNVINTSIEKTIQETTNTKIYGLYYLWTKDQALNFDLAKRYEFVKAIENGSDKSIEEKLATLPSDLRNLYNESKDLNFGFTHENQLLYQPKNLKLSDVTGDYYLYVVAKAYNEANVTTQRFGPFRMDNEAPVISDIKLAPNSKSDVKNMSFELSDYSLDLKDGKLENIKNIMLYASELPLNDLSAARKILLYGTANANEYNIDGTGTEHNVGLQINKENNKYILTFSLDCIKHLGFNDTKEAGIYYIGFSAEDSLGNKLELEKYSRALPFDTRSEIEAELYDGGTLLTDDVIEGCYIIDMNGVDAPKTLKIKNKALSSEGYNYQISSLVRYDKNSTVDIDLTATNSYFENYQPGADINELSFSTINKPCGYYEAKTCLINKVNSEDTRYTNVIRFYIIDSSSNPDTLNYINLYQKHNVVKNEVFSLEETQYHYRTGVLMGAQSSKNYNLTEEPQVFSSKAKALDYVKRMEYLDLYPVILTNEYIGNITIDQSETVVPAIGQIWIRYKASNWDSNKNQSWAYYYSTLTDLPIDVTNIETFAPNLYSAINSVSESIVESGSTTYIINIDNYLNGNGAPVISAKKIPNGEVFNSTNSGTALLNNEYKFDEELFSDDVLDTRLATWYNFKYYPFTKVFYALEGTDTFTYFTGNNLGSVIDTSGKYTIKEYDGAGLKTYSAYVDKDVPTLTTSYINNAGEAVDLSFNQINHGDFIHSKEFVIKGISDVDEYSYFMIYNITDKTNDLKRLVYAKDFNEEIKLQNDNIYRILVSDLSGNSYEFKVSVTDKELNVTLDVIDNDKVVVTAKDRNVNTISTFSVNYNGTEKDYDFAQAGNDSKAEFIEAGDYEFIITDLYGYSVKLSTSLTRINVGENKNLVWYEKIGNAFVEAANVSTTDGINYYVKSDKMLYLKLDSDTIYGYETTGQVTVTKVHENEGIYLKTESSQSARWSLKLYYLKYPDNFAVYSRIDERGSSWLNDYEVSLSASMIEFDGEVDVIQNDKIKLYVATKIPGLGGTEFDKVSDLKIATHIKTESYSAISGVDFDSLDDDIYLTYKDYEVLYQPFYINVRTLKWGVDGNSAYFYVKLSDIMTEGFSINQNHSQIKVTISTQTRYNTLYAYSTTMISEYLTAETFQTDINYTNEDSAGKKFWHYVNFGERTSDRARTYNDFVNRGLAVLYVENDAHLDEKWVKLSSNLDIAFYDKDKNGTQLFSGSYTSMNESKVYFGISVSGGNVQEVSANFSDAPNSFKDVTEDYDRTKGYYVRVPSRKLAISYVNGSDYFRKYYNWNNTWIIIDETAPTITGWYIDNFNYTKGEKLNIIVTFSEPVHINGNASDVKLNAMLKGTGSFADKNVSFVCQGNLGLDRLVFSYDPSTDVNNGSIDNIIVAGITNSTRILDYGRNIENQNNSLISLPNESELKRNKVAPSDLRSDLTIKYDSSVPEMNILTPAEENYKSEYDVEIIVNGKELSGVYYLATTQDSIDFNLAERYGLLSSINNSSKSIEEQLANYSSDFKAKYEEIKQYDIGYVSPKELYESNNKISIHIGGVTGGYYLYVYAKSYYDDGSDLLNKYGVYRLSNDAPEIKNIKEADSSSEKRTIKFEIEDYTINYADGNISGLTSAILYLSESPLSDLAAATKILLYGTTTLDDIKIFTGEDSLDVKFTVDENGKIIGSFTLDSKKHLGFNNEKEAGSYYIGISATNALDNASKIYEASNTIAFDTRSEIGASVYIGEQQIPDDIIKNAYIIDISGGNKNIEIRHNGNFTYNYNYVIKNAYRYNSSLSLVTDINEYFSGYADSTNNTITFTTKENSVGYYEIRTAVIKQGAETTDADYMKSTNIIRLYIINGSNSITDNYKAIYKSNGNIIVNEVFCLNTTAYYYREGQMMGVATKASYNNSAEPLVFSSREKAREYIKAMEYLDMYPVIFTAADILSYQNGNLRIDPSEVRKPQAGDIWIRYKSPSWRFSTAQSDWVYYYYKDKSTGTDLDVRDEVANQHRIRELAPNLYNAIDVVVSSILGKGSMIYLTDLNGSLDDHGVPNIASSRIPSGQDFTKTKMDTNLAYNTYEFDSDIFYDTVSNTDVSIATWYKFNYSSITKIFYKKVGAEKFDAFKSSYLSDVITESGEYVIREYDDKGMREYQVYVDKTAPTVVVTYQDIKKQTNPNVWLKQDSDGSFFHTNSFMINLLFDNEVNDDYDAYKANRLIDRYASVTVVDLTTGERILHNFSSINNNFSVEKPEGITLPEGVFEIIVSDRSGNKFSFNVSVISEEKALRADITVIPNDKIIVSIPNRDKATISSFIYNDRMIDKSVDFASASVLVDGTYQISFIEEGFYGFTISDLYGYTIVPNEEANENCGTLTRVRISENDKIEWFTIENGDYKRLKSEDVDKSGENIIYIKTDKALSLKLDSPDIYSYDFTGNVKYTRRIVDGNVYLDITSNERWSVRLYYTNFPDNYITYNRLGAATVVPTEINLSADNTNLAGVVQPDSNNNIIVYVSAASAISGEIKVTIRTKNRSAIAELGDYESYNSTVTLSPTQPRAKIVILTHPSGYSTYDNGVLTTRTFDVVIDKIEGNGEAGKGEIECAVEAEYEFFVVEKNGIKVFEYYLKGESALMESISFDGNVYDSKGTTDSYDATNTLKINRTWINNFLKSGLADIYVTSDFTISDLDEIFSGTSQGDLRVSLLDSVTGENIFRVLLDSVGSSRNVSLGYNYGGVAGAKAEAYDAKTSILLNETRGNAVIGRYYKIPASSDGNIYFNIHEDIGNITPSGDYTALIAMMMLDGSVYILAARSISNFYGYSTLLDSSRPTVVGWYLDNHPLKLGEKMRLSVRFTEPVYINGKAPVINAKAASNSSSLEFKYKGGAGTDTLYFEYDPENDVNAVLIDEIILESFSNQNSIVDYAYNISKENNRLDSQELPKEAQKCNLDSRTPGINMTNEIKPNPVKSAVANLAFSRVSTGATLYYSWTVDSEPPVDYALSKEITTNYLNGIDIEGTSMSGVYYLHTRIESAYGKSEAKTFGPFYFDNLAPIITDLYVEDPTKALEKRTVSFTINEAPKGSAGSQIENIYLYYGIHGSTDNNSLVLYNKDSSTNHFEISENGRVSFTLYYSDLNLPTESQGYYDIALYASDTLGNVSNVANYVFCNELVNFDNRSTIDIRVDTDAKPIFATEDINVYDSNSSTKFRFTFSYQADEYNINEFYLGDNLIEKDQYDNYLTIENELDGITLTFKEGLVGYYRLNLIASSGFGSSMAERVSRDFGFYISNGFNSSITNNFDAVKNGTVFINKVYFLGTYAFYYNDGSAIKQINYNDTALLQAFSTIEKAKEFVRYYELLDLGILRINTSAVAESLNSGDGSYRKASQDNSIRADIDQVWIRYKRSTWSESTSADAWVYYYYGSSTDIDLDNLPASLNLAVNQVVDTIVSKGKYEYLTSSNEGLNKYNSPSLNKKQINTERLSTYDSKAGASFRVANTFSGDPGIYNSEVNPAGFDACSLATTYQFVYSNYTKLFYVRDDGTSRISEKDLKILPENTVFGELDLAEGVYWVREIDENGARDYQVYIDKTAPHVILKYVNASDEEVRMEIDSSVNGLSYGWKSISILGITNEIDDMAYVAVYKKNGTLHGVYRKDEIPTDGIEIPEGIYYFEILDRSGNMYKINVALTDSPLEVKVLISDNRFLKVDCNREDNQIVSYEIYLDDQLIESNYSISNSFYQAGSYRVYVRDSYGFKFDNNYELKRELPVVTWYYSENSTYVQYDGNQDFIKMVKTGEKEYQITTNRLLTFMYDDSNGYIYEFNQKGISSQSQYSGKVRVTLNKEIDWTLTVKYERYPEIYITYHCIFDNTAPIITVDASQDIVSYNDQLQVDEANETITADSPNIFTPDDIFFTISDSNNISVKDGQSIYANLLRVKFSDKSICNSVEVYLNGTLIGEYKDNNGVKDVTLSRLGYYEIKAKDTLGNESKFSFSNEETVSFEYEVDGLISAVKKNPSTLIVDGEYPTDAYGYKNLSIVYNGSATIVFLVKKGEESRYLRYRLIDGALYEVEFSKEEIENQKGKYHYKESFTNIVKNVNELEAGASVRIADEARDLVNIYLKLDEYMNISYYVEASEEEITVYSRLNYANTYEPYFAKTVLCGKTPTVTLVHTNPDAKTKEITPESVDKLVTLNGEFIVKNIDFRANKITEVLIGYSETTEFNEYQVVYNLANGYTEVKFSEDGLYSLVVTNEYGNKAEYRMILASDFRVVTKVIYEDEVTNQYSAKTKDVLKTNGEVQIDIYSTTVRYVVTYNDILDEEKQISNDNGICTLSFDKEGLYNILIIDSFENEVTVEFEINKEKEIVFKKDYLTGYNEKALRYDEGYTNKRLSVDKNKLLADDIKEIKIIFNGEEQTIFNLLVENPKEILDEDLIDVVGQFGDGVYTVFIRNNYGNTTTYDIHYLESIPLTLTRQIRTSNTEENIEISSSDIKVYSNFIVNLSTIASIFEVKVDGATKDMPLELRFPTDGETDEGEYVYNVTYIDEYGFEYNIEVNLVRKKLDIDLAKHMKVEVIDETNMTKDDVQIDFDTTLKCEYTLNGSERIPYHSGEVLSNDGTYRFYLTDKAGNIHTAAIKKDTIVEYIFTYEGTERVVENGSVINSGRVKFSPVNKDSAEIKIIALNGETYKGNSTTTFAEDGKWEILIQDKMNNSSYFSFHIITHSLSSFDYTTPYTYKITDIIFDSGDGIEISYLGNVIQNDFNSRMKFTEAGKYYVTSKSDATATVLTFEVTIDKVAPKVELVGAKDGEATIDNVTIKGCSVNDTVNVYKDGELIQTVKVTSASTKMPEINEKGEYKIEVINLAGNVTTLTFTRKYTANVATTVAIMLGLTLISTAIFIGLIYRKRMKV